MTEHPSLVLPEDKVQDEEVEKVAVSFYEKVREIVENRRKLKETNEELLVLLKETIMKLDSLVSLKSVNAVKEAEVLELLERELNR